MSLTQAERQYVQAVLNADSGMDQGQRRFGPWDGVSVAEMQLNLERSEALVAGMAEMTAQMTHEMLFRACRQTTEERLTTQRYHEQFMRAVSEQGAQQ